MIPKADMKSLLIQTANVLPKNACDIDDVIVDEWCERLSAYSSGQVIDMLYKIYETSLSFPSLELAHGYLSGKVIFLNAN